MIDAIEAHDIPAIVEHLTARAPTFTGRELDNALAYGGLDKKQRGAFRAEILAHQNVIGLREEPAFAEASAGRAQGPVYRYTTRQVLAGEMALQRGAQRLAGDYSHGLSDGRMAATAAAYTLKPEQADALRQLAGPEGFAMLWGEAGTGKSHTLNAVRAAYEAEGCKVVGLSWTNDVAQQMRGDGFANAATIASELKRLEHGRTDWRGAVLIVDEAAMISTDNLAKLYGPTAETHAAAAERSTAAASRGCDTQGTGEKLGSRRINPAARRASRSGACCAAGRCGEVQPASASLEIVATPTLYAFEAMGAHRRGRTDQGRAVRGRSPWRGYAARFDLQM